ncbi:MAG: tyrosinase family protein [Xanthobacteraceae bacterium]
MGLTRRAFARGGAALAAAALAPRRAWSADIVLVRRSIGDLIRDESPLIASYRRAVDEMMKRDVADKTSWAFQANIYGIVDAEITDSRKPLAKYWRQGPHRTYFFLSWQRMYLHFFERIVRRASGDPIFALPYWAYDDPQQALMPEPFRPDANERNSAPAERQNALARAKRLAAVERGEIGLGDIADDIKAALLPERFAAAGPLDAGRSFGGVRVTDPGQAASAGGIEAIGHRVHGRIGRDGDMGSPATAARDPLFFLHQSNIDRLWVKWTDPERGRVPPVGDEVWMKTAFTFVDENGDDRRMTGADILDTQHQLGYRYDDDPPRAARLTFDSVAAGGQTEPPEEVVLARGRGVELSARESHLVLAAVPRPRGRSNAKRKPKGKVMSRPRMHVVLRDVIAGDRTPAYDVFLLLEGTNVFQATTTSVRLGAIELFGALGTGRSGRDDGEDIVFGATDAIAKLSKTRGYNLRHLRVSIVRRAVPDGAGKESVPRDPSPPIIGAIELVQF